MIALATTAVVLTGIVAPTPTATPARAALSLTVAQAHNAAKFALEGTLSTLVYRDAGTATTSVRGCRVKARRGTCFGQVEGVLTCKVRLRVLLAGYKPASEDGAVVLVWADRVACA